MEEVDSTKSKSDDASEPAMEEVISTKSNVSDHKLL